MKCYRLKILVRFPNGTPRSFLPLLYSWESRTYRRYQSCLKLLCDVESVIGAFYGDFFVTHFRHGRGLCVHKRFLFGYSTRIPFAIISIIEENC